MMDAHLLNMELIKCFSSFRAFPVPSEKKVNQVYLEQMVSLVMLVARVLQASPAHQENLVLLDWL